MLFIIGNGFDIALGLKTSYRDFLQWYISTSDKKDTESIKKLKATIKNDIDSNNSTVKSWADLEIRLGEYTSEFSDDEVDEFILVYSDIKEKLNEYLKEQVKTITNGEVEADASKSVRNFFTEIYDFFPVQPQQRLKKLIFDINSDVTYSFVNLNYTNTLEFFLDTKDKTLRTRMPANITRYDTIGNIVQIHGPVDNFLMGVDNESQIVNETFRNNPDVRRTMIKTQVNYELEEAVPDEVTKLIDTTGLICFFGVSLGDSDISWWKKIGEWLKAHSYRNIVIFWYSKDSEPQLHQNLRLKAADNVRKRFANQAGLNDTDLEELKDRIYVQIFSDNPNQHHENRRNIADEKWYKALENLTLPLAEE
ncbi:MAG: bacteriophage abortive infection AbiH family protein [Oscillospiraceae bacterium]|jgi:hypothetical protein|nr:bacteriophage abortive infection AbiH family protein [Oscillospiraceae bacterium]